MFWSSCCDKLELTVYINIPCGGQLVITQFSKFLLLWSSFVVDVTLVYVCMDENHKGKSAFQRFTRLIFMIAPFLLYFLSSLFLSLNSSSLFLLLHPFLISLPPTLLLPMASFFLIFTDARYEVSFCSSIMVLPICPLSSPSIPPRGKPNFSIFTESAPKPIQSISRDVRMCVCPSVILCSLHFNVFPPPSQSPMSKLFRYSESFGGNNGKKWSQV